MARRACAAIALTIAGGITGLNTLACGDGGGGVGGVEKRAEFDPGAIEFGLVRIGELYEQPVELIAHGLADAMIEEVRFDGDDGAFAARSDRGSLRGSRIPASGIVEVRVLFEPAAEGDHSTVLLVGVADLEARLDITARARERRAAAPEIDPARIDFGNIELGRDASRPFVLWNVGEDPGELREVRPKSSASAIPFSVRNPNGTHPVPLEIEGERSQAIELYAHFAPETVSAFAEDLDLIFANGTQTTLRLTGSGTPAGSLSCDTTAIDFGRIERGNTVVRPVHCSVSGGTYTLRRLEPSATSAPFFYVRNAPTEVAPDGTLDFEIAFDARGVALPHSGAIDIEAFHGALTQIELDAEVAPPAPGATDISVTLSWDTDLTDFDVHLVRAGGSPFDRANDCYYGEKSPDWGISGETLDNPFLDRDETGGFGPEQINLTSAAEEVFDLYVHFYDYDSSQPPLTTITMQISLRGIDLGTVTHTLDFCGSTWHVGTFDFGGPMPTFMSDTLITNTYRSRASARCQ